MSARILAALIALFLLAIAGSASAHELRPCLLTISALGEGRYEVVWKAPPGAPEPAPIFPPSCHSQAESTSRFTLDCGPAGLAGQTIGVRGLDTAGTDAVVYFTAGGETVSAVLRRDSPSLQIPAAPAASRAGLGRTYLGLGVEHILTGPDHLLFVLGLLLLVRRSTPPGARRRGLVVAKTVTAFTAAHSVTLALASLGVLHIPPAPVEAMIALSLFFLATELSRPVESAPQSPPWVMAFAFGLLHGLGFAGALVKLGLPVGHVPLALFLFNAGVEIGQLLFVAVAMAILHLARSAILRAPRVVLRLPAYVLGSFSACWCFERVASFWA